jgi:hypothetical protein
MTIIPKLDYTLGSSSKSGGIQMENIIQIDGKVKYPITLDPGVWIFDDRRIDLLTYTFGNQEAADDLEEYTKAISRHWDREISEGAIHPPTLKVEKRFEKEKVLNGTFGIPFKPFLTNSVPIEGASALLIKGATEDTEIPLDMAYDLILAFSEKGKPLKEDGPVHIYYGDGSNRNSPLKNIRAFIVK